MDSLERFLSNHPRKNREGPQTLTRAVWGGIALEFDRMYDAIESVSRNAVHWENLEGDELDELIIRWTGIRRVEGESDESRRRLMRALFVRGGIPSWVTTHSIKKVFSYYFDPMTIRIVENAVEGNLISNGDFEAFPPGTKSSPFGSWVPSGSSISVIDSDSFEALKSLQGVDTGAVYTDVTVASDIPHILLTPYKGTLPVKVQRLSDSKYWNFSTWTWQSASVSLSLENLGTDFVLDERVILPGGTGTFRITYGPAGAGKSFIADYLFFDQKPTYPFFRVLVSTFGQAGDYLNNWPGAADPVGGTDYDNATFLGQDYIGGEGSGIPTTFYQMILEIIKPAGVKAVFEFIGRD